MIVLCARKKHPAKMPGAFFLPDCYNNREKFHPTKSAVVITSRFTTIFTTTMGKVVPFFAKLCPFLREQVKRAKPH